MSYNPFYNIENTELMGYEYAWVNFVNYGKITQDIISKEILSSWNRCKEYGINPKSFVVPTAHGEIIEERPLNSSANELICVAMPIIKEIVHSFGDEDLHVLIADIDGTVVLDVASDNYKESVINGRKGMFFESINEKDIGTNSMTLALFHKASISVVGAQHYLQCLHKYAEYATPIYLNNEIIIGVICILVRTEEMSDYIMAMVTTAARAIENDLQLAESNKIIFGQNKEKQALLDNITDGVVYVDDGKISQFNERMEELTGYTKNELLGKKISTLKTSPSIKTIENMMKDNADDIRVIIEGRRDKHSCFLKKELVSEIDEGKEKSVWIFKVLDDIQMLADKINIHDVAYFTFNDIVGKAEKVIEAKELARRAALYETRVIIEGESGTGKEMYAQAIHNASPRKNGAFVAVDCGAIPRELFESEIFGYEEGAYTGARRGGNRGKFELAHKGTLFLDEINNISLEMQAKLLRVLQESKVVRLGGHVPFASNVQIIVATNIDISEEVKRGTFREDLFYRLNIVHIKLPSLRERKDDIPLLIDNYLHKRRTGEEKKINGIDDESLQILSQYSWPGNVRQLNNVLERMAIMSDDKILKKKCIPEEIYNEIYCGLDKSEIFGSEYSLEEMNARYIQAVVKKSSGKIQKSANVLGISRATVYKYLKIAEGIK